MTKHPESESESESERDRAPVSRSPFHLCPAKSWYRVHVQPLHLDARPSSSSRPFPLEVNYFAMSQMPLLAPIYLPGQEPVAPGTTPEERQEMQQMVKYGKYASYAMESCPVKVVMSGGAGESLYWNTQ